MKTSLHGILADRRELTVSEFFTSTLYGFEISDTASFGLPQAISGSGLGMTLWLSSMAIFIASSLMGSLNYVVTVINLRTKGMTMTRLPLTIWAFFVTAIIGIVSFPVLLSAALLLDISFGMKAESEAVINAVDQVLKKGYRTGDIADASTDKSLILGTDAIGEEILKLI